MLTTACITVRADQIAKPFEFAPPSAQQRALHATVLGALEIIPESHLHELSDLAWDQDEHVLYAISDAGYIVALQPKIEGTQLVDVDLLWSAPLRDMNGAPLQGTEADSEGLVLFNDHNDVRRDTVLAVSFEHHPRICYFTPRGEFRGEVRLPQPLQAIANYQTPNQALEALSWSPTLGFITGPERPLRGETNDVIEIYAENNQHWTFPTVAPQGALVGMAALAADQFIVLERRYLSRWQPLVISLRKITLTTPVTSEVLAVFDSSAGWRVDNFEGIAHHRDNRYFMVSDDNENSLQKTLLVYLALKLK